MDRSVPDALGRTHAHLTMLTRGQHREVLDRWRSQCPELRHAPVETLADLKGWVHQLPAEQADRVLRYLVTVAQRQRVADPGDPVALLAIVACLEPGIRSLATRSAITCDEAVSEIALGVLDFPVERRTRVAAGLLLDARNRLHRSARRQRRHFPLDEAAIADAHRSRATVAADPQEDRSAAQRVVQIVCDAHRQGHLNRTDANLILHTRIGGHQVKPIATELGLSITAAYQRRSRAEARLAELVA